MSLTAKLARMMRRPAPALARRPPLTALPDRVGRFCFIGGLHRSGTSILHRVLRAQDWTAGIENSTAPEDEGQHLQSLFRPAKAYGGPGRFAFDPRARLTEADVADPAADRERLLREWGAYMDVAKPVLLEKSPPNLLRARYFQALFEDAAFVMIVRHPIANALATRKWSGTTMSELFLHWSVAHELLLLDWPFVRSGVILRYEDLVSEPARSVGRVFALLGNRGAAAVGMEEVADRNPGYFDRWTEIAGRDPDFVESIWPRPVMARFGYALTPPYVREAGDAALSRP